MNKQVIAQIFNRFRAQNPQPVTELCYTTAFELLVAVILSAQATDIRVNLVTKQLFSQANTPEAILNLGEAKLKEAIQSIGLYNSKASNIIKTCQALIASHQGQVPETRAALEALPGVGRKTANVILNTFFHQPTLAVDTHVFRVAHRIGLSKGKTPLAVELALLKLISQTDLEYAHHWFILHGRYTCTARNPRCKTCIIEDLCEYPTKNFSAAKLLSAP